MIKDFDDLNRKQKQEWFQSLEVGDEVIIRRTYSGIGGNVTFHKGTVKSITNKTGRINVSVGEQKYTFTNDGKYWGNRSDSWSRVYYELRQIDELFINHRRKVIAQTIFEESMKKLANSYNELKTVEEVESYARTINKALQELKL